MLYILRYSINWLSRKYATPAPIKWDHVADSVYDDLPVMKSSIIEALRASGIVNLRCKNARRMCLITSECMGVCSFGLANKRVPCPRNDPSTIVDFRKPRPADNNFACRRIYTVTFSSFKTSSVTEECKGYPLFMWVLFLVIQGHNMRHTLNSYLAIHFHSSISGFTATSKQLATQRVITTFS